MPGDESLSVREYEILSAAIREYIETGEPVASRSLSKRRKDGLSAASIRNAMADLADRGYLSQPHTSAGRIPTEKAFRYYVRSAVASRISLAEAQRIRLELGGAETAEQRVGLSSHILVEMTRNVAIAAAQPTAGQILDQIELVPLTDGRLLAVLVTRDHSVRNRVLDLDHPIAQEELISIRNYVNHHFAGWTISQIRQELLRRMDAERAAYDAMMRRLLMLYGKGLLDVNDPPAIHMEGAANLFGIDLQLTREKMRDLFRALEEKKRLVTLLDRLLDSASGELQVQVGLEAVHPSMKPLCLIGLAVEMPSGHTAKIAVLGPVRMHYERVMGAVLHIGQSLANPSGAAVPPSSIC
ncbi:MAG: heat-inducible transcription repressor HrcA [Bryobacterales bacterium]|nr:heat-inducible transcription repressor HrcA [Bryobacterales bacterium]